MLTARTVEEPYVEAASAVRDGAYRCRACGEPVTLKAGQVRIAHFAHRPDSACAEGARMSPAHWRAQQILAEALRARGVSVELEARLASLAGDRRIDLLAYPADRPGARVAIEVQQADITVEAMAARTASYWAEDVAPLWLRLIDFDRFERVQALPARGTVWIEDYRARAWERWAHDSLLQRLWVLDVAHGLLWRAALVEAPGRWPGLELDGPFAPGALRLRRLRNPEGRLAADLVGAQAPPRAPPRFVERRDGAEVFQELCTEAGGRWAPAVAEGAPRNWRVEGAPLRPILVPRA